MSEMTENGTKRYKLKEVCIRLAEGHPLYSDVPLSSPTAALDVMRRELSQYDREVLCVVNLNNKLKPINFNIVSMGSINGSIAAIPNILKSGILSNAYGFLLLHNHPSGEVTPLLWRLPVPMRRRRKQNARASEPLPPVPPPSKSWYSAALSSVKAIRKRNT